MNFPDLWSMLTRKRPELLNPSAKLEFTSENLQSLLKQAYRKGDEAGMSHAESSIDTFGGIFKNLAGRTKQR